MPAFAVPLRCCSAPDITLHPMPCCAVCWCPCGVCGRSKSSWTSDVKGTTTEAGRTLCCSKRDTVLCSRWLLTAPPAGWVGGLHVQAAPPAGCCSSSAWPDLEQQQHMQARTWPAGAGAGGAECSCAQDAQAPMPGSGSCLGGCTHTAASNCSWGPHPTGLATGARMLGGFALWGG